MKRYIPVLLLSIATAFGCSSEIEFTPIAPPSPAGNSDLLISEISTAINTDANANGTRPHYVEIYNGTNESIDLSNYAIGYFATTDAATLTDWTFPAGNFLVLTSKLDKSKCYVIAAQSADATVIKRDITWGTSTNASNPLQLSGNSAIALLKKDAAGTIVLGTANYKIIDVFGSPQVARVTSTGSSSARNNFVWTIAGETDTRNRTFFRKATVNNPTTDWNKAKGTTAVDSEWQVSADRAWDYTNLGLPTK
ncbi:lamin tail domain-containing protein [Pedobacter xixiisoli]|uniref:Lamin Tail Domain n=1 Tax=Pedobacter xixiisoli TaxID=1476464 RepID=A0A286AEE4_9SPHI|nr:lamin tail domain-containing protein [Pedobacter xixiisoli]SOD20273.1 Lamin Tail Domain [Pedobacter xixiisoli]